MGRIKKEKKVIKVMIKLYCFKIHGNKNDLCKECSDLMKYSLRRLDNCMFGENKTSCKKCPVHCYNKTMGNEIKKVMKFSGPRLVFYRPIDFLEYIYKDIFKD